MTNTFEQLGKYEIKAEIGRGRAGVVYEAHDTEGDRPVVVKALTTPLIHDEAFQGRFAQYAQTLVGFNHPNILKVYDCGIDLERGLVYLVTPFIGGGALSERLGEPWPIQEAVRIAAEAARALDYAHQRGLVHGDIRSGNVLLTEGGWALVTDFGLAPLLGTNLDADVQLYWPPERLADGPVTPDADLYALGVLLYEMLAGHPPFAAQNAEMMRQQKQAGAPSLRQLRADVPRSLEKILSKIMAADGGRRYATAVELARALENSLPSDAPPPGQRARPMTPPTGVQAAVPPRQPVAIQEVPTIVQPVETGRKLEGAPPPRRRVGAFLWRATKWVLGKVAAALVVLSLVAVALLIGASFLLSAIAEQALATREWHLEGWERGGEAVISEKDLQQPLQDAVDLYVLGVLTDLSADFQPPDVVELRGRFRERPVTLQARVIARDDAPYIQLQRLNGVPLYVIGGIISKGVNEGLRSSWENAPVRLAVLNVREDYIQAILESRFDFIALPATVTPAVTPQPTPTRAPTSTPVPPTPTILFSPALTLTDTPLPTSAPTSTPAPASSPTPAPTSTPADNPTPTATPAGEQPTPTPSPLPPPPPGASGRIVYTVDAGNKTYYLASADPLWSQGQILDPVSYERSTCSGGSTATTLAGQSVSLFYGYRCSIGFPKECPSPDGVYKVTIWRSEDNYSLTVYRTSDNTAVQAIYSGPLNVEEPILWSPDSAHFYFTIDRTLHWASPQATGYQPVASSAYEPHLSPDGLMILYMRPVGGVGAYDVWVANADGSNSHNATNAPETYKLCARWTSP